MSRIGNAPIAIPKGVTVTADGGTVSVKGPKGALAHSCRPEVSVEVGDDTILVVAVEGTSGADLAGNLRALAGL